MDKQRRKELVMEYKQQQTTGGVYRIYNSESGRSLIKADINLGAVRNRFNFSKKMDSCLMLKLQQDWTRFGAESFTLEILDEMEKRNEESTRDFRNRLQDLEDHWKLKYSTDGFELY